MSFAAIMEKIGNYGGRGLDKRVCCTDKTLIGIDIVWLMGKYRLLGYPFGE